MVVVVVAMLMMMMREIEICVALMSLRRICGDVGRSSCSRTVADNIHTIICISYTQRRLYISSTYIFFVQ